ncbi:phosphotransferase family protein [Neorhizobium galegae]|uniref:phosphotransferase family protein n=1 Tax=Neorhizobium galegae TaxID=399 RepID=UPI0021031A26|nr:aminoglycoside phosphotransferase family protein [Neorhizobium galegae]MCQ1855359.1 aminoglycoside phosphotransferase family protein [Neorhizobium galegae]
MKLEAETVLGLIRDFEPALTIRGFSRLAGGSTEVYKIDVAGSRNGSLVLKIYPDLPKWGPSKEALVAGWLKDLMPPVPTWLRTDESRSLMPLRYSLMTYLPGRSLRHWMGQTDITQAYRQMGELLRRIHAVRMPAYGYVLAEGIDNPISTNAEYMTMAFDNVFRRFRVLGGDPDLANRLGRLAESNFDLLDTSEGAVLAHDDLHQGNVLALRGNSGEPELSGLIDFGNARAADSLFDLAKALFCSAHEDPRSYQPILEGYGSVNHPEIKRVLRLYTLFHRLSMWCWLTKIGIGTKNGPDSLIRDLNEMAIEELRAGSD